MRKIFLLSHLLAIYVFSAHVLAAESKIPIATVKSVAKSVSSSKTSSAISKAKISKLKAPIKKAITSKLKAPIKKVKTPKRKAALKFDKFKPATLSTKKPIATVKKTHKIPVNSIPVRRVIPSTIPLGTNKLSEKIAAKRAISRRKLTSKISLGDLMKRSQGSAGRKVGQSNNFGVKGLKGHNVSANSAGSKTNSRFGREALGNTNGVSSSVNDFTRLGKPLISSDSTRQSQETSDYGTTINSMGKRGENSFYIRKRDSNGVDSLVYVDPDRHTEDELFEVFTPWETYEQALKEQGNSPDGKVLQANMNEANANADADSATVDAVMTAHPGKSVVVMEEAKDPETTDDSGGVVDTVIGWFSSDDEDKEKEKEPETAETSECKEGEEGCKTQTPSTNDETTVAEDEPDGSNATVDDLNDDGVLAGNDTSGGVNTGDETEPAGGGDIHQIIGPDSHIQDFSGNNVIINASDLNQSVEKIVERVNIRSD